MAHHWGVKTCHTFSQGLSQIHCARGSAFLDAFLRAHARARAVGSLLTRVSRGFRLLPSLKPVGSHRNCIEIPMGYSFGATRHDTSCARGIACIVAFRCAFRPALAGIRGGETVSRGFRPRRRTGGRARRSGPGLKMGSGWICFLWSVGSGDLIRICVCAGVQKTGGLACDTL